MELLTALWRSLLPFLLVLFFWTIPVLFLAWYFFSLFWQGILTQKKGPPEGRPNCRVAEERSATV